MALAMSFIRMVLPVLGWATMRARCPLPMGEKRSTTRTERLSPRPLQSWNFSSGKSGVRCSKGLRSRMLRGSQPLTLSTEVSWKKRLPFCGGITVPFTVSPVLRE